MVNSSIGLLFDPPPSPDSFVIKWDDFPDGTNDFFDIPLFLGVDGLNGVVVVSFGDVGDVKTTKKLFESEQIMGINRKSIED